MGTAEANADVHSADILELRFSLLHYCGSEYIFLSASPPAWSYYKFRLSGP